MQELFETALLVIIVVDLALASGWLLYQAVLSERYKCLDRERRKERWRRIGK